jgi:hypothetical protein
LQRYAALGRSLPKRRGPVVRLRAAHLEIAN